MTFCLLKLVWFADICWFADRGKAAHPFFLSVAFNQTLKLIGAGVVVWDLIIAGNGALAGLVSITGPCGFVNTWAAFIIGGIGGFVYFVSSKVNLNLLKVTSHSFK